MFSLSFSFWAFWGRGPSPIRFLPKFLSSRLHSSSVTSSSPNSWFQPLFLMFSLPRCSPSTPSHFPLFLFLMLLASQFLYNFIVSVTLFVRPTSSDDFATVWRRNGHCLCFSFNIFAHLICLKWCCVGATVLLTFFLHEILKSIKKKRSSLRFCVANHFLYFP